MHELKAGVYEQITLTDDSKKLKELAQELRGIEFKLQELWGFPQDGNFHRFWEAPKCKCPKMDNKDRYPHRQIISSKCPLHGD